jgi:hypothetical protein
MAVKLRLMRVGIPEKEFAHVARSDEGSVHGVAHRLLQGGSTTWFGTFYDGHLTEQSNYLRFTTPKAHWQVELTMENDFAHLREGNFIQRLWGVKGVYAWNPNLVLSTFVQISELDDALRFVPCQRPSRRAPRRRKLLQIGPGFFNTAGG